MTAAFIEPENPRRYEITELLKGRPIAYLVGFYVFAFYLELHIRMPVLQTVRFQFTLGALIGGICLFFYINDKLKEKGLSALSKTTFILILYFGIFAIFSENPAESQRVYGDRMVKFALLAFFIYAGVEKVADLRVIVLFMLLAWLKMGQEGFLGQITGSLVWENQGIQRLHGSTSVYKHPNSFSGFAVGSLPFVVYFFMAAQSKLIKLALFTIGVFSLIVILYTGSRTGYLATFLGASYFFLKLKKNKFRILLAAFTCFLITLPHIPQDYKDRFTSIYTGKEKEGSSSEKRKEILVDAIAVFKVYPMGVGVGAFSTVRGRMFDRYQDTHNLYFEILTNTGFIGLFIFFIYIHKLISQGKKNISLLNGEKVGLNTPDLSFLKALSYAVIGFIIIRLLLGMFGMDMYEIYWWLALGYTLAIKKLCHLNKTTEVN